MSLLERAGLGLLRRIDPETAHAIALRALRAGLAPRPGPVSSDRLAVRLAGMDLPNPLGLAAGFDKNAVALDPLARAGFGFLEVGAATPRPQAGNPRPRLWRLPADRAAINRFGFNNDGAEAIAARLSAHLSARLADRVADRLSGGRPAVPVGLNLGANKDSADRAADFAEVLRICGPHVDFATVNVSSPNTERLRDLQGKAALTEVLQAVKAARDGVRQESDRSPTRRIPLFLKISPDLTAAELADIAEVALALDLDGIVATNTTLSRAGLAADPSDPGGNPGGLSGAPLRDRATAVLSDLYRLTGGRIPLIGVGGIATGADAYARIRAGATALQLYTALSYAGLSLVPRLLAELDALLLRDGFANVSSAVGADHAAAASSRG